MTLSSPDAEVVVARISPCKRGMPRLFPLFLCRVAASFPSPADDYIDRPLDLNELLIRHQAATFFVRARGDSMIGAGIHDGDLLVVDRAIQAASGHIVIAALDGDLTVKRVLRRGARLFLEAASTQYPLLEVNEETDFRVWGVVTHVIHSLKDVGI